MREKLVSLQAVFFIFFYLIMCVLYSGVNTLACNSAVMAYKKTLPRNHPPKI
jgi:hypothetical protein